MDEKKNHREITILKADGQRELFDRNKLYQSLKRSGAIAAVCEKVVKHIENELINEMSTSDIYRHAFSLLQQHQKPVAARYSLRRALVGFGPTGFPFEDYVAEIFRSLGYQAETGKILKGACVEHEVDVVAWKQDELLMSEVKFHNELGMKSDLKVALYVKARFDDLKNSSFFIDQKQRKLNEGILITNTKFSERAIEYGECIGLRMIGWNYPDKENLHDYIEKAHLHPLTCITVLNNQHKQELFSRGIVLARTLTDDKSILKSLGLKEHDIKLIEDEVANLKK